MALVMRNTPEKVTLTAFSANTDTPVAWNGNDDHMILVLSVTTSASTITVKAGNSIQGVSDLSFSAPVGTSLIKLESGRFKNVSGINKGKIVLSSSSANASWGVAELL